MWRRNERGRFKMGGERRQDTMRRREIVKEITMLLTRRDKKLALTSLSWLPFSSWWDKE